MNEIDQELLSRLVDIKNYCQKNCTHLERWPSYFERRFLEFLSYLELLPAKRFGRVLELGCGAGYQSAFLAQIAENVVATDLPNEDITTHTPGMLQAKELHHELKIRNVELIGCSAESLPFDSNSFDLVYSSHVLEHIPDQEKALKEIYRVLKPGGIHFCVVPTSFEKVYSLVNYYVYLGKRSVHHIIRKVTPTKQSNTSKADVNNNSDLKSAMSAQLKYFPFPPAHGHSSHFLTEFKIWTRSKWRKKVEAAGSFKLINQSSTQVNPILPLFGEIFPIAGTRIHSLTRKTERKLGNWNMFQWFGINTVMIFQKLPSEY